MANVLAVALVLFAIASSFIGATQAFWLAVLFSGVAFVVLGLLMFFSQSFRNKYYHTYAYDPESERVLSENEKEFFRRYSFPQRPIAAGACLIVLYLGTHQYLLSGIVSWLRTSF